MEAIDNFTQTRHCSSPGNDQPETVLDYVDDMTSVLSFSEALVDCARCLLPLVSLRENDRKSLDGGWACGYRPKANTLPLLLGHVEGMLFRASSTEGDEIELSLALAECCKGLASAACADQSIAHRKLNVGAGSVFGVNVREISITILLDHAMRLTHQGLEDGRILYRALQACSPHVLKQKV